MERKILILTDSTGFLSLKMQGTKEKHTNSIIDVKKIIDELRKDFIVESIKYADIDFNKCYRDWYVIYASSEERGLIYKSYIEDVLLKLAYDGAILIPSFLYFRAHGNKSFQEILRKTILDNKIGKLESDIIGRLEDLDLSKYQNYPYVIKTSAGFASKGVGIARNEKELFGLIKKYSYVRYIDMAFPFIKDILYIPLFWELKKWLYKLFAKDHPKLNPRRWLHANKVIIQQYIEELSGDYKILYYMGKFYVLKRENRKNDFRASGSGKFSFPQDVTSIEEVLTFARKVTHAINAPMISMDIARNQNDCYLIEFQCVCFGPYTMQFSEWHFEFDEKCNKWIRCDGKDDIENETSRSIREFIYLLEQKRQ